MVKDVRSQDVNVLSGVPQRNVLLSLLFKLHTSDLSIIVENALVGYADDSILVAEEIKPGNRMPAISFPNYDLAHIGN